MPAHNPFEHWPESDTESHDAEHATIGLHNVFSQSEQRFFIRLERSMVLNALRNRITELRPFMHQHDGTALFRTPLADGERRTLITTDERIAGRKATAIVSNLFRPPIYGEVNFPDGLILEATNFYVPNVGRRFSYYHEILSRTRQEKGFEKTEFASTILHRGDEVTLRGGMLADQLPPLPAGSLKGVSAFSGNYLQALDVLRHCNVVSFEEHAANLRIAS